MTMAEFVRLHTLNIHTHLSCRRTEALRGGVVMGGGVVGSSAVGEPECITDMFMVLCVFESTLAVHHNTMLQRQKQYHQSSFPVKHKNNADD